MRINLILGLLCCMTLASAIYTYDEIGDSQSYDNCWQNSTASNIYDSNWTTYARFNETSDCSDGLEGYSTYYVNYTKITEALSTTAWKVKDAEGTEYASMDAGCWAQNPLQFKVQSAWVDAVPDDWKYTNWSCWTGSSWSSMRLSSTDYKAYEEGVYWNRTDPIKSINSDRNDSIKTIHTFNVTLNDNGNCTLSLNGTRYASSTASSYQENANSTREDCVPASSCDLLHDGNWSTNANEGDGGNRMVYLNYSRPATAHRAIWETKDGVSTSNTTIPESCFKQSVLQLRMAIDAIPLTHVYWSCWTGSAWFNVVSSASTTEAYEEAIWWYGTNDNLTWVKTLNPGNYSTIYYTCNTSWGKQNSTSFWLYVDTIPPVFTDMQPANLSQYSSAYANTDVDVTLTTDEEVSKCGYSLTSEQLSAMTAMPTLNAGPPYYQHTFSATLPTVNVQRCWFIRCNDTQGNNQTYATTYCLYVNSSIGGGGSTPPGGGPSGNGTIIVLGDLVATPSRVYDLYPHQYGKHYNRSVYTSLTLGVCNFTKFKCTIADNALIFSYPADEATIPNTPVYFVSEIGTICKTSGECGQYIAELQVINLNWHVPFVGLPQIPFITSPNGINIIPTVMLMLLVYMIWSYSQPKGRTYRVRMS